MSVRTALRQLREDQGLTQADVARMAHTSPSAIGMFENGQRTLGSDCVCRIAEETGDARLYFAAVAEVTGGVFASPYLDGDRVDLHRSSVLAKLKEELREAREAAEGIDLVNMPQRDEYTCRRMEAFLLQLLDARVCIDQFCAVTGPLFDISMQRLYARHEQKLRERRYKK